MLEVRHIVGIRNRDPNARGRLYLTKDGTLARDVKDADLVEPNRLHKAIRTAQGFSSTFFTLEVADETQRH